MFYEGRIDFGPIVAEGGESMGRNCDSSGLWFGGCLIVRRRDEGMIRIVRKRGSEDGILRRCAFLLKRR